MNNEYIDNEKNKFYVMNQDAQFWSGLKHSIAVFSNNFDDAKPLYRQEQFDCLKRLTTHKIEKIKDGN